MSEASSAVMNDTKLHKNTQTARLTEGHANTARLEQTPSDRSDPFTHLPFAVLVATI